MRKVGVAEARKRFRVLLEEVSEGKEVRVLRRGKEIARIVPTRTAKRQRLPSLAPLRASIAVKGRSLSAAVTRARRAERY